MAWSVAKYETIRQINFDFKLINTERKKTKAADGQTQNSIFDALFDDIIRKEVEAPPMGSEPDDNSKSSLCAIPDSAYPPKKNYVLSISEKKKRKTIAPIDSPQ